VQLRGGFWLSLALTAALAGCGQRPARPPAPAVAVTHFVNARDNARAPALAAHFVAFSFDYPSTWTLDPRTGSPTASNFVKVARRDAEQTELESVAVGSFHGPGAGPVEPALLPALLDDLESQAAAGFRAYRRVDAGAVTIDGRPARQIRFTAAGFAGGRPLRVFGRIILLPGPSADGVVLLLQATDASRDFRSVEDVGVAGQTPVVLRSFRLGA